MAKARPDSTGVGQERRLRGEGQCRAQNRGISYLIVIIVLTLDRDTIKLEPGAAVEVTAGDRLRIGVEWVHARKENRPFAGHIRCLKLLGEPYDIGGGANANECTTAALESEVLCRGGNLSFSGFLPGANGITERSKDPAAELARKNEAQVTVFTDLQNLGRILLDCQVRAGTFLAEAAFVVGQARAHLS